MGPLAVSTRRRRLLVANWKMALKASEAAHLTRGLAPKAMALSHTDLWLTPSFPHLEAVVRAAGNSGIAVGAQNVFWEKAGAFTGEVSAPQLLELGCHFAIVGHSERRHIFGESLEHCVERACSAFAQGLNVIFCVGETLPQRESQQTLKVLEEQIGSLFERIEATARPDSITRQDQLRSDPQIRAATLTIAYEPVWAIGTGKAAQPTDIAEAHQFLHNLFRKRGTGESPRILYGGSVSGNNFGALLAIPHVDGALVGKASLDLASFSELISISERS